MQSAEFAKTTQENILDFLGSANELRLFDNIWESGRLLSAVTKIPRNVTPVAITGVGYKHRDNNIKNNQIGTQELPSPPQLKPEIKKVELKRFNVNFSITLSKEARDSSFVEKITRRELNNACVNAVERGLLYGIGSHPGILTQLGANAKNWATNQKPPAGSGAWWSGEGAFMMVYKYLEAGYQKENAIFFAGNRVYAQLFSFRRSGSNTTSLIDFDSNGVARFYGIPMYPINALDEGDLIIGDFSMLFLRIIDQSSSDFLAPNNASLKINYNAIFDAGFADKSCFNRYTIGTSSYHY